MPKNSKEAIQAHSTFLQTENFKKCKEIPFDRIRKFSKKIRIVPKKTNGETLWSRLYSWKHKKFVAWCKNRTRDLLLLRKSVEQMNKRL